ncbi:MAG: ABC transporter ATP-binding protein [Betaproteobacteria bacterium]|nr:ABC transporter ATP-binding protein [Betaproteobacteria bacterium]
MSAARPLLATRGLAASYGDFQALFDIDFEVGVGETVAIIGANGAGKSTLLRAIVGSLPSAADMVVYDGAPIGHLPAHDVVRLGVALVPEGRKLFQSLSVEENLRIGGDYARPGAWTLARVYALFPRLAERRHTVSTSLSGGEQQMVAIGRALMSNPRLLLCDELSLGLAPVVIREIYTCLTTIAAAGTTLVIVEQDINRALEAANRFYCLQKGCVSLTGSARNVDRQAITAAYFGLEAAAK